MFHGLRHFVVSTSESIYALFRHIYHCIYSGEKFDFSRVYLELLEQRIHLSYNCESFRSSARLMAMMRMCGGNNMYPILCKINSDWRREIAFTL